MWTPTQPGSRATATSTASTSAPLHGWNNTPVTVTYTCSDEPSGIADCPDPTTLTAEGVDQSATGTATDRARNTATTTVDDINIDLTVPTLTHTISGTANAAGWYRTAPTISFTCADDLSDVLRCPAPVQVGNDGAGQAIVASTEDHASNTASITVTVNVDRTAPTGIVTGVVDGATYPLNQLPTPGCLNNDSTSGMATDASLNLSRDASGTYTATCSGATDKAGNQAEPLTVTYHVAVTTGSLTALTGQYVLASSSPDSNGVLHDLTNNSPTTRSASTSPRCSPSRRGLTPR